MKKITPKHAVICAFLGQTRDRFHQYNEVRNLEEKLKLAGQIPGVSGIEAVFPYEVKGTSQLIELLKKNNLSLAAINVNVKAEPEFRDGGLTSIDKAIREKAICFIKEAKDFAKAVGANKVTCCPLGDGYEFSFHCHYAKMWKYLVESFREAGEYCPEIPLFIEYKPSETRGRCFVDTAAKALVLLNDIGLGEMGITVDFGHSIYGQENPAEVIAMLAESRYPYYVHINDNDGRWDWDYMVGTRHLLDYIEFLYYLQEYEYDDFLTSDTSPTRWDIKGTFTVNTRLTNKIWNHLYELNRDQLRSLISARDYLKTWSFIENEILALR
ncbi:MAG: sugar phosphate isomerase/epimerase [Sedimentisphaerales bacterium]|nr:sugar phosphate isomerase/epimerase [Sedimentisphaerales bacterium]